MHRYSHYLNAGANEKIEKSRYLYDVDLFCQALLAKPLIKWKERISLTLKTF